MATVYRGQRSEPRGTVRIQKQGRRRTLRISDTFASSYTPGESGSGPVWEAMSVCSLALSGPRPKVLVLGLAGASVVRAVLAHKPGARFVGVEIDPEVVSAARRWFDLDQLPVEVKTADAADYLESSRSRFDLIIEDIFVGRGRSVHKPDWLPEPGLLRARGLLRPRGVLVSNTLDEASRVQRCLRRHFKYRVGIEIFGWDNRVLLASDAALSGRELRRRASGSHVLGETFSNLRFRAF